MIRNIYKSTDMTHDLTLQGPQHLKLDVHHSRQPQGPKTGVQPQTRQNIESVVYEIFSRNIQRSCLIVFFFYECWKSYQIILYGFDILHVASFSFLSLLIHLLIFPDVLYLANTTKGLTRWATTMGEWDGYGTKLRRKACESGRYVCDSRRKVPIVGHLGGREREYLSPNVIISWWL